MAAATAKWRLRPRHLVGSCPCRAGAGRGRGVGGLGPPRAQRRPSTELPGHPRRPQLCVSQLVQFWGWVAGKWGPDQRAGNGRSLALQTLGTPSIIRAAPRNSRANSLVGADSPFFLPKVQRSAVRTSSVDSAECGVVLSDLASFPTRILPVFCFRKLFIFPSPPVLSTFFRDAFKPRRILLPAPNPRRSPHPPRIFKRKVRACVSPSGWAAPRKMRREEGDHWDGLRARRLLAGLVGFAWTVLPPGHEAQWFLTEL